MKSVGQLAKELNVGSQTIIDALEYAGILNFNFSSLIPDTHLDEITRLVNIEIKKIEKRFVNNQNEHVLIQELSENIFNIEKQQVRHKKKLIIHSHFTDYEAIVICSKMSDSIVRKFANRYKSMSYPINRPLVLYQLHYIAMKALDYYGGRILTFLYKLPIKPNNQVVSALLKSKKVIKHSNANDIINFNIKEPTFPYLEFRADDNLNYFIRFSRVIERANYNYSFSVYDSKRKLLYSVNRDAEIIPNLENRVPEIALFTTFVNGQNEMYSGYDSTLCDICGHVLTDDLSVALGRGPTCRSYYRINKLI